jgi:hypothetical protein
MVFSDICDHADLWSRQNVGCIQTPTQANLDHGNFYFLLSEETEGDRSEEFEVSEPAAQLSRLSSDIFCPTVEA